MSSFLEMLELARAKAMTSIEELGPLPEREATFVSLARVAHRDFRQRADAGTVDNKARELLGDEAADAPQVEEGRKLRAVAEGARRGQHRVAQGDAREVDARVDGGIAAHGRPSQSTVSAANTGPSRQTSANPPPCSGAAQPRQTPKPQAMGFSNDTLHGRPCASASSAQRRIIGVGPQA